MKKKIAQRIHAKRRMLERFNVVINRKDLHEIALLIRNNKAKFSYRISSRLTRWVVSDFYQLPKMVVIYDSRRNQIITVMPYKDSKEERRDHNADRDRRIFDEKRESVSDLKDHGDGAQGEQFPIHNGPKQVPIGA